MVAETLLCQGRNLTAQNFMVKVQGAVRRTKKSGINYMTTRTAVVQHNAVNSDANDQMLAPAKAV